MNSPTDMYCPSCQYKILWEEYLYMICDAECPNCKQYNISRFYQVGSDTHRCVLREYELGFRHKKSVNCPPPLPEED